MFVRNNSLFSNPPSSFDYSKEHPFDRIDTPKDTDIRQDDNEESDKTSSVMMRPRDYLVYGIGIATLLVYSITAFVLDFNRARALFIMESVALLVLVSRAVVRSDFDTQVFHNVCENIESFCHQPWVRFTCMAILITGFGAYVVLLIIEESARGISAMGLVTLLIGSYLCSWKRSQVIWRPIVWGLVLQLSLALLILQTSVGQQVFEFAGQQVLVLLGYTDVGSAMVFNYLATGSVETGLIPVFAFSVLPTIIFFSSLVSIFYYYGLLQAIITVLAKGMAMTLGTSASESLNAAGNIFIGQTEAPLLIRPFLAEMTLSEMHAVMTGGFATIAGGVMAIYIRFDVSASHLLTASVLSAPAALAISKLIYPETEVSATAAGVSIVIPCATENNVIEAAANGASLAVGLAANITAMLIAFLALVAMVDAWVAYAGSLVGWADASFVAICGHVFYPLAFLMGIPASNCLAMGELLGYKIFVNEFIAYQKLMELKAAGALTDRTIVIATYALCGFSNLGSIGVQLGGLTTLAPRRSGDLAKVVFSAMVAGNIACFMTACVAGLLY